MESFLGFIVFCVGIYFIVRHNKKKKAERERKQELQRQEEDAKHEAQYRANWNNINSLAKTGRDYMQKNGIRFDEKTNIFQYDSDDASSIFAKRNVPKSQYTKINVTTKKARAQCRKEFVVIDFETTGLNAEDDKIIEMAAVKYQNFTEVDRFSTLVNPQVHIERNITNITGITDEMVKHSPRITDVLPSFLRFIGGSIIVAHNASFDMGFLRVNAQRMNMEVTNPVLDTLSACRKVFPDFENHKLQTVIKNLCIKVDDQHRAEADARATCQILIKAIDLLDRLDEEKKREKELAKMQDV